MNSKGNKVEITAMAGMIKSFKYSLHQNYLD